MQWYVGVDNGVLPAIFSKEVGVVVCIVGFLVCFAIIFIGIIVIALRNFLLPDKKSSGEEEVATDNTDNHG
jgi:hypothetical protein